MSDAELRCAICDEQFEAHRHYKPSGPPVDETDEFYCPNGHRAYIHYAGGHEVQRAGIKREQRPSV